MSDRQTAVRSRKPKRARTTARRQRRSGKWRRGWVIAVLAILSALPLLFHRWVPNSVGNLGSLLDTFLPWVGVAIPVLAVAALVRRSATAGVALLVPLAVWGLMFGHLLIPGKGGGAYDLRVLSHNVDAANPDPERTAQDLIDADADVVALEEITPADLKIYKTRFAATYPHVVARGTVALWSKFPVEESESVDVGFGWTRALRAEVTTPEGKVAFYVAHLASVRVGASGFTSNQRNATIKQLGQQIAAEKRAGVVVMGDFNGTANDRSLAPLTAGLRSAQGAAGHGFGFTWPAKFPMARIDHIMVRGVTPTKAWVLPSTGSDHRPVVAEIRI